MGRRRLPSTPEQEALRARWREAKRRQRERAREATAFARAERAARREAEREARKAAQRAEREARKAAQRAEREARKAVERAEREARKAVERAEREARKAVERAERAARREAEREARKAAQRALWREAKRRQRERARLVVALAASAWSLLDAASEYVGRARASVADGQAEQALDVLEQAAPLLVAAARDAEQLTGAGADEQAEEVRTRGQELAEEVEQLSAEAAALIAEAARVAEVLATIDAQPDEPAPPELVQLNGGAFTIDATGDSWRSSQSIVDKCNEPGLKTLLDNDVLYIRATFETEARELLDVRIPCSIIRMGTAAVQAWIESAEIRLEAYLYEVIADGYEEY